MEINSTYQSQGLMDADAASLKNELFSQGMSRGKSAQKGDNVEISSEARELFAQMGHASSGITAGTENTKASPEGSMQAGGAKEVVSSGSGQSASSSATSAQSLRSQIESLRSQLNSLSGNDGGGSDQASGINSQIAALEAELQSVESAG